MSGNSFGQIFKITTFGESHGKSIGVIIDGVPAGLSVDLDAVQFEMQRRKPGQSALTTARDEADLVQVQSGIFESVTTGSPIMLLIQNKDQRSKDYRHIKEVYRPSHADFTYQTKYGHRDYRGGGRSSARETAARVAAGAIAKQFLATLDVQVSAYVSSVHDIDVPLSYNELDLNQTDEHPTRCPHNETAQKMEAAILAAKAKGDSLGGRVTGVIKGCPVGLGEPVFDKFHAELGKAMLSINAVKGFEYGSGFSGTRLTGSQHNDQFQQTANGITTKTNNSGGVQGGITNGMDIYFNVAFKPTATVLQQQTTINKQGETVQMDGKGRHDPCVLPRAVPIVEAMAALVTADLLLRARSNQL